MKRKIGAVLLCLGIAFAITVCTGAAAENEQAALNWEDNGLPVVFLEIDPQEFEKVNESPDHSYRAPGASIRVVVPDSERDEQEDGEEHKEEASDGETLELDYIRGRGHGTWIADKKPYRFKLKKGADLLGMGKNKHWILLANRYDTSLLRNRIIAYMGEQMGLAYTPEGVPVELVVNGEYYGSYVLCEQVRIGKSRVGIEELEPEDVEEPEVTGGYLLSLNPDYGEAEENVFLTDRMVRFGAEEPQFSEGENGVAEQKAYISSYVQKTEDAIFSVGSGEGNEEEPAEESGPDWTGYMDMRSAADYWWIQEFSGNNDAFITSSTYLYKDRSGKLCWGPLWDFDLSLGDGLDSYDGFLHRNMIWLDHLRAYDTGYQQLLRERWKVLDQVIDEVVRKDGVIDQYAEEIRMSWEDDQRRWPIEDENGEVLEQDFEAEVQRLREWIMQRRAWINGHIDEELTHVYNTVTFLDGGEILRTEQVLSGSSPDRLPQAPYKDGWIFSHWADEEGEPYDYGWIEQDTDLYAVYLPREEAGVTEGIYFVNPQDVWVDIRSKRYEPVFELLPEETIDRSIRWSSSDPELAATDEYGTITLKGTGEVTIRASLYTGAENSFVLHIYDPRLQEQTNAEEQAAGQPGTEQLIVEEEALTMDPGEYHQIPVSAEPRPGSVDIQYRSDDESVAVVDTFGVIHTLRKGTARITIWDSGHPDRTMTVEVTVRAPEIPVTPES